MASTPPAAHDPRPLRIGLSTRLMHKVPAELGFRGKTLQYLEQTFAHWIMAHGALALMVPTLGYDAEVSRRKVQLSQYVQALDALMLQGGADVSPGMYGQQPLRPEWAGDPVRDAYEIELIEAFIGADKPVLGVCRGHQLINVAFGGSLYQDILTQRAGAIGHVDRDAYDRHHHRIGITPGSRLAALYPGQDEAVVNSIHHQAVDRLGDGLMVEALGLEDGVIEAVRGTGQPYVVGVQWHPEFHWRHPDRLDPEPLMAEFMRAAQARVAHG
jgi:putative glutamine amidotransferase